MTTTRDVITRALKELRVIGAGEEPETSEAEDALDKLNSIMHELSALGASYTHTELALGDDFPFDDELINSAVMWLAMNLTGIFGTGITQDQYNQGLDGRETIWAAYLTVPDSSFDSGLYRTPSNRRYWN